MNLSQMSVSRKIWFLFFGILVIIVLLFSSYYFFRVGQNSLYLSANLQNMSKILDASLTSYENQYFSFIRDYTSWDELVDFTYSRNKRWAFENMASALSNYGLNFLNIFNLKKELIYYPEESRPLPGISSHVFDVISEKHSVHYYVSDGGRILEVFGATINNSLDIEKKGRQYGFFFVGMVWNNQKTAQFEQMTGYSIKLAAYNEKEKELSGDIHIVKELQDIDGNPVAVLQVSSDNQFIHTANRLSVYELISFVILTLILLSLASWTIHRHIALPLKKLARALQFNDSSILKTMHSNDEFSDIAKMVLNSFQQEEMLINETIRLKELEANLSESENRFRSYFNNSPESIVIMNDQGKFIEVNQAAMVSTGYGREEILNMYFPDVLPPEENEKARRAFRELSVDRHHQNEFRIRKKDGGYLDVVINSYLSKDNEYISFCQDVTDLKAKEHALKESEEKFVTLFYSTPVSVIILTLDDKKIIDVNVAFEEVFGYRKEEVVGRTSLEAGFVDSGDRRAFYDELEAKGIAKSMRYRFVSKNGKHRYGLVSGVKLSTAHQDFLVATITDVSNLKEAEDKLSQLNQTLEERVRDEVEKNREKDLLMLKQSRLAAMGATIHNIAHQWRQPLNALGILIQNIRNHVSDPDFQTAYLANFERKTMDLVMHLSRTIDDFRNFFKIDRDKIEFKLKDVILQTVGIIEATYKNNYIRLDLKLDRDMSLMGYPNEYAQVLLNVLNNSKEAFVEKKVQEPRVMIALDSNEEGCSVVRITDNAGGIPEEIIHRVFDPYFTTKNTGTGIGLYMSKYIIEKRMNGKITLRNVPGGLEVKIEI